MVSLQKMSNHLMLYTAQELSTNPLYYIDLLIILSLPFGSALTEGKVTLFSLSKFLIFSITQCHLNK